MKTIAPILRDMSQLPNMKMWLSADRETGYPQDVPKGARVAWLVTQKAEDTDASDLIFLDTPLRKAIPLEMAERVCPTETGEAGGLTCATCKLCWSD